jgi:hypothetical protein
MGNFFPPPRDIVAYGNTLGCPQEGHTPKWDSQGAKLREINSGDPQHAPPQVGLNVNPFTKVSRWLVHRGVD